MTKVNVDIKPIGVESAILYAPFNKALESLTKNGYEIISLPQNAELRIQRGKDHYVSKNGNWVKEGILYVPRERNKLVRNSPILVGSAKEATKAYKTGKEFYLIREQIEQSLTDSVDFPEETIEIPTNRFNSEALTVYAFGGEKKAKAYGEFLDDAGIKEMPVHPVDKDYVNKQSQPFARQMWFRSLDSRSGFVGDLSGFNDDGYFLNDNRGRGIKIIPS